VQRQNKIAGGQATAAAWLREPPWYEPSLEEERILMMDYVSTPSRAKGVDPPPPLLMSCEEGHTEATAARPPKASSPPTIDGVDKMYRQLVKIHAIVAMQLAECIC
jgi:hypothetical protein